MFVVVQIKALLGLICFLLCIFGCWDMGGWLLCGQPIACIRESRKTGAGCVIYGLWLVGWKFGKVSEGG